MPHELERLRTALADRYWIERELGRGGMATVYLARDLKHERRVAIKVLQPDLAAVLGSERFPREIKLTAQLNPMACRTESAILRYSKRQGQVLSATPVLLVTRPDLIRARPNRLRKKCCPARSSSRSRGGSSGSRG
jgi:serine/threonine protein kinase